MEFEIGVDITSITRINRMVEKFGLPFLQRFLLTNEILLTYKNLDFLDSYNIIQTHDDSNTNPITQNKSATHEDLLKLPTHCFLKHIPLSFTTKQKQCYEKNMESIIHSLAKNFSITLVKISTIAGFWALKEACSKALGVGIGKQLNFHDICIFKDIYGKPHLAIHENKISQWNIKKISVSISHDCNIAFAICVIA